MKKFVLFLLLSTALQAQNAVGIAIYQDAKLAFFEDNYGNTPFTLDISGKLKLQSSNVVVSVKFEYADLTDDYYRYGAELGYCFYHKGFGVMPFGGYGKSWRTDDYTRTSWEFGGEVTFKILPNVKLAYQMVWTQRPELGVLRFNHNAGLQFDIDTDWRKKQARKGTRF